MGEVVQSGWPFDALQLEAVEVVEEAVKPAKAIAECGLMRRRVVRDFEPCVTGLMSCISFIQGTSTQSPKPPDPLKPN